MKARVIATGEIVEVYHYGKPYYIEYIDEKAGRLFHPEELDLLDDPDYWTRLEHQYAGMVMQGMLSNEYTHKLYLDNKNYPNGLLNDSIKIAHALVEKMKEERK